MEYKKYKWGPHAKFMVGLQKDLINKIIPFFKKYPLQAKKRKQFEFFCKVENMILKGEHRNLEGIEKIRLMREKQHIDSLDALDAHVQWGVE